MPITLNTRIIELHRHDIARLSQLMAKKLAVAVATFAEKVEPDEANVEDLLNYFPMRYEDRSNFLQIEQLYDGIEATVELYTRISGGYQVGKNRDRKRPPLFIFEVSGGDRERTRKPVVVFWFISGKTAKHAMEYYQERFARGTRFAAFGKWEWDGRRWRHVLARGPSNRQAYALAYDSRRRQIVLVGGQTLVRPSSYIGDAWSWDGRRWSPIVSDPQRSPGPRAGATLLDDPHNGRLLYFGGYTGPPFRGVQELWYLTRHGWQPSNP